MYILRLLLGLFVGYWVTFYIWVTPLKKLAKDSTLVLNTVIKEKEKTGNI
jgi:hypothetical protein